MIPLVQLKDKLLKKDDANHESEIFDLATDSLQLLAYTHRDISNVRRKFLKPAVAQKYKRLCSAMYRYHHICLEMIWISNLNL